MKGFTLIESLVAVTVLMISIVGPVSIMHRTYSTAFIAKDKLTASYLAQEGIEYVRAVRDNAFLANATNGWANFRANVEGKCNADASPAQTCSLLPAGLANCVGDACFVRANTSTGIGYTQGSVLAGRTVFKRQISVSHIPPNEEKVTSVVSWVDHGTTYNVTIADHLTPWQ